MGKKLLTGKVARFCISFLTRRKTPEGEKRQTKKPPSDLASQSICIPQKWKVDNHLFLETCSRTDWGMIVFSSLRLVRSNGDVTHDKRMMEHVLRTFMGTATDTCMRTKGMMPSLSLLLLWIKRKSGKRKRSHNQPVIYPPSYY